MKAADIKVGGIYQNKRGWQRLVLNIDKHFKRELTYRVLSGRSSGEVWDMTIRRFADWAVSEVKDE